LKLARLSAILAKIQKISAAKRGVMHGLSFAGRAAFFAISVIACVFVAEAQAASRGPSFGCRAAAAADERTICRSAELSNLDRQLAQAFNRARSKLGARKARSFAGRILRARQGCRSNAACIKRVQMNGLDSYRVAGVIADIVPREQAAPAPQEEPKEERQEPQAKPSPPPVAKPKVAKPEVVKPEVVRPEVVKLRCHMDSCGFAKLFSVSPLLRSEQGVLMAVWASNISIKAPLDRDGVPDYDEIARPRKFPPPADVDFVFCSAATPLVIAHAETADGLEAFPLAIGNAELIAGAAVSDHLYYWAVCHNKFLDEDGLYSPELDRKAKQLGYLDAKSKSIDSDSISFKSLNELFHYLRLN
jgi:uncharacterized protein